MFLHTSLQSQLFKTQNVRFALTHRFGGVSNGAFDALNLGYLVGDELENVAHNHQSVTIRFYDEFHIAKHRRKPLYYMEQIHSTQSIILNENLESHLALESSLKGEDAIDKPHSICLGKADAIITQLPLRICLALVADCNPLLLYDTKNRAMAVIHAGRKGVFYGILPHTFMQMNTLYGTQAQDCLLYVGASIRSCCYEVGQEVYKELLALGFSDGAMKGNKLDMLHCIYAQCENLGIKKECIEVNPHCSCCNNELYSYRREGVTGRFGLLAMLV